MAPSQKTSLILLVISVKLCECLELTHEGTKKQAWFCKQQMATPTFNKYLVVGKSWRIYYSWNVEMEDKCLDFVVKNATEAIITRIWYDMHNYLEKEPNWKSASLHTTLGSTKHELLLIDDGAIPGSFDGVPYILRDDLSRITTSQSSIPLFKFFLKLVHDHKYLVMMDCRMGIATLLSRERPPRRAEVVRVARALRLGEGGPACLHEEGMEDYLIEHNIT